jgi:hypothetical protein
MVSGKHIPLVLKPGIVMGPGKGIGMPGDDHFPGVMVEMGTTEVVGIITVHPEMNSAHLLSG